MKTARAGRAVVLFLGVAMSGSVLAQGGPGGWMGHGMMGGQGPWGPVSGTASEIPDAMLDAMAERMVQMHEFITKLTATTDAEERRQLMREHLASVHPVMGPGMMMGPGQMVGPDGRGMPGMMNPWGRYGHGYPRHFMPQHMQAEASWHRSMEARLERIEQLLKSR